MLRACRRTCCIVARVRVHPLPARAFRVTDLIVVVVVITNIFTFIFFCHHHLLLLFCIHSSLLGVFSLKPRGGIHVDFASLVGRSPAGGFFPSIIDSQLAPLSACMPQSARVDEGRNCSTPLVKACTVEGGGDDCLLSDPGSEFRKGGCRKMLPVKLYLVPGAYCL